MLRCHETHHVELFLAEKAVLVLVKLSERQLYLVQLLAALQREQSNMAECRYGVEVNKGRI